MTDKEASAELPLIVGHTYEAKKPGRVGTMLDPLWNDRQILWIGVAEVQYDSPSVACGRRMPRVGIEQFRKWAGRDITDKMPKGEWRSARRESANG